MDGTLLRGTSASMLIAERLDLVPQFEELERDLLTGAVDSPGYARRAYALWAGLTEEHVAAAFAAAPWLDGIREVWAEIAARGEYCAVVSLSPDFFVSRLCAWGAHAARASVFPVPPFPPGAVLDPARILLPASKVTVADELCVRYGVSRGDCVAYGDSRSDTELFAAVPVSVAVNGDAHVSSLATHRYRGGDLREAYALVAGA
jgi:phosphoserine phosphatase